MIKKKIVKFCLSLAVFSLLVSQGFVSNVSAYDKNLNLIEKLEEDIKKEGSSVERELTIVSKQFDDSDGKDIEATQELIEVYTDFKGNQESRSKIASAVASSGLYETINHGPTIAAIIAWFSVKGYKLSAELLTHMRANKKVNSQYIPKNGSVIKASQTTKNIAKRTATKGSATYQKKGGTKELDCYYALRRVNFTKPSKKSKKVTITDRYDFAMEGNATLEKFAITACFFAQNSGYLKPFKVKITVNM